MTDYMESKNCLVCGSIFGRTYENIGYWLKRKFCSKRCSGLALGSHQTHGEKQTHFWKSWSRMKGRCNSKHPVQWKYYGSKGIIFCERWSLYKNFREDMYSSYVDHIKIFGEKNTTLDRINNSQGYCFENCRWATKSVQARNKTNNRFIIYKGQKKTIIQWAEEKGIKLVTLRARINNGWSSKRALTI